MTSPVADEPASAGSEEMVLGPRPRRPLPRWLVLLTLVLAAILLAAVVVDRIRPAPLAALSLAELEDAYAGMVRSDGTNDASVMTRRGVTDASVAITPDHCVALVETTVLNRFPAAARDGVGAYWLGNGSTVSLFTLRFDDVAAAEAERDRILAGLDGCTDRSVFVRRSDSSTIQAWEATVARTSAGTGADNQVGYTLSGQDGVMAIQVMPYLNTLSWQYRYETGGGPYLPTAADRLMWSLRSQLDSVVAARPR